MVNPDMRLERKLKVEKLKVEVKVKLYSFFNLGARLVLVVNAIPRPLYPWERPGTHWVGLRVGLGGCAKSHPPMGFDSQTVQPIVSHYTD
jgi:hypothetical protein